MENNEHRGGGPKTREGKEIAKMNALKHGLLSKEVLLKGEDEEKLIELVKRLRNDLKPVTEMERFLVDRIATNVWRLKRAMQMEREMMEDSRKPTFGDRLNNLGETLTHYDIAHNDIYGKFIRYESSIERGIFKALHELERMQASRNGQAVPLPIAVDMDISVEKQDEFVS